MDEDIRQFWINLRASLLMEAKSLQELRAAKLAQAADIQRLIFGEKKSDIIEETKKPRNAETSGD